MPDAISAHERRITLRMLSYWEKLRAGRPMPAVGDPRESDIVDLWGNCFLLECAPAGLHYQYIGSVIRHLAQTGIVRPGSGLGGAPAKEFAKACEKLEENRRPLLQEGEYRLEAGVLRFRQCLLPLGEGRVEAVLGGMRCRLVSLS